MNGKGSKPRNCFSKQFKNNYDAINWSGKFSGPVEVTLVMGFLPKNRQAILPILYTRKSKS